MSSQQYLDNFITDTLVQAMQWGEKSFQATRRDRNVLRQLSPVAGQDCDDSCMVDTSAAITPQLWRRKRMLHAPGQPPGGQCSVSVHSQKTGEARPRRNTCLGRAFPMLRVCSYFQPNKPLPWDGVCITIILMNGCILKNYCILQYIFPIAMFFVGRREQIFHRKESTWIRQ